MSDNLPPSKFGAGYTYGGGPAQPSAPAPSYSQPAPPTPPSYSQPVAPPAPPPLPPLPPTPSISYPTIAPVTAPEPTPAPAPVYTAPVIGYQPSSSGATAITAGVLALLLGAYQVWQTISAFAALSVFSAFGELIGDYGRIKTLATISAFASLAATLALILGGILLLCRKSAGRGFIAAGCLVVIIFTVLTVGLLLDWFGSTFSISQLDVPTATVLVMNVAVGAAVPILTMVLALLGSTKRWCQAKSGAVGYAPVTY